MTFFENQAQAKRKTVALVLLYLIAVGGIIVSIYAAIVLSISLSDIRTFSQDKQFIWQPKLFFSTACIILAITSLGTTIKILQLAKGGIAVAHALGGTVVYPDSQDPLERKILNIVEEVAIASGTHIPQIYIMQAEAGINAFAAGYTANNAVIGISRGCLEYLSRDELQGVIAHEFSHILNGDIRLNVRLIGILHGIVVLTVLGRGLIRMSTAGNRRRHSRDNSFVAMLGIGLILVVLGSIGIFFAKLIKSAISRQREFLADAAAVQFTRNPQGIGGALKKIGSLQQGSILRSPAAEEVSHLCFANAVRSLFNVSRLFATHPPLILRIQQIDPSFSGEFPPIEKRAEDSLEQGHASFASPDGQATRGELSTDGLRENILESVGLLTPQGIALSQERLEKIPDSILDACRTPLDAGAVLCCLLLSDEPSMQRQQIQKIETILPESMFALMPRYVPLVSSLAAKQHLPTLDIIIASVRNVSKSQFLQLRLAVDTLIHEDEHVSVFEYALYTIFTRALDQEFGLTQEPLRPVKDLRRIVQPVSRLLFALSHLGTEASDTAQRAYVIACKELGVHPELQLPITAAENLCTTFLDEALQPIRSISPTLQEKIFAACITCIVTDEEITVKEMELIRAIGDTLGCPVPTDIIAAPLSSLS